MVLGAGNALDLLASHSRGRFDGFDCGDDGGDGGLLVTRERLFDKIRKGNLTYPRYLSEHAQGILHGVRERVQRCCQPGRYFESQQVEPSR